MWGKVASPGVRCEKKRKSNEATWLEKLGVVDGIVRNKRAKILNPPPCPSPSYRKGLGLEDPADDEDQPTLDMKTLGPVSNLKSPFTPPYHSMPGRTIQDEEDKTFDLTSLPSERRLKMPQNLSLYEYSWQLSGIVNRINTTPKRKLTQSAFHLAKEFATPPQTLPTPPVSADSKNVYGSKPIVRFLRDAFVWFAQPFNSPRPTWRPATQNFLAASSRLHSLESLMLGCGWQGGVAGRMKYGVVFVDDSSASGKSWKAYALKMLQDKHASLAPGISVMPIWVFESNVLGFEALEKVVDVEALALCRFN